MNTTMFFLAPLVGTILGYIYGLSFLATRKKAFSYYQDYQDNPQYKKNLFAIAALNILRIFFFIFILWYVLRYSTLNAMLVLAAFFIAFWITIIKKKV